MSVTIDITGLPHERLFFAPSPLAELTSMLHVLAEPAHHPALHGWATGTATALKPGLADRLLEADFLWRSSRADFLVPGRPAATLARNSTPSTASTTNAMWPPPSSPSADPPG